MKARRLAGAGLLTSALVVVAAATTTSAQDAQRLRPPTESASDVPTVVSQKADKPFYDPMAWEVPGLELPTLPLALVETTSEDDGQLTFLERNELGRFRPAPEGGSVFFGSGLPLWGPAAPRVLASRVLRPMGTGDAGDRFLGKRPAINPVTVVPKLGETFNGKRESFAFLGGPPPLEPLHDEGSTRFPLAAMLLADPDPDVPDNRRRPNRPPVPPTTTPLLSGLRPTATTLLSTPRQVTVPGPGPGPGGPSVVTQPAPGTTSSTSTSTSTTTSTSTSTSSTTSTTTNTTSTTSASTTSTSTTSTTTTTSTTIPGGPAASTTLVLGNNRGGGEDRSELCLSSAGTTTPDATASCDRLFNLANLRPGRPTAINLTLWNVDPESNSDGIDLRGYAEGGCLDGVVDNTRPAGTGNLCEGLRLRIYRYSDAGRTANEQCLSGCTGSGTTLEDHAANHTTMANGVQISNDFKVNSRAYLKIVIELPSTGTTNGRGNENKYMGRTANVRPVWRLASA